MNEYYKKNYLNNGAHLGAIYPFISQELPDQFSFNMAEVIDFRRKLGLNIELDKVALVEKACLPYLLGNRTLLNNVERAPWLHSYLNKQWYNESLPAHGSEDPHKEKFVADLKAELLQEASSYIGNSKTVGILLSGGMDSRVVAGVVRELQQNNHHINVVGVTWGNTNSRDVVYSQRICSQFDWEFIHFPITAETLRHNIKVSSKMGAEVSPMHFHTMSDVANLKGIDVILAGSYGDSVGRAEFSGTHVTNLRSILPNKINRLGLIKAELFKDVHKSIIEDSKIPDTYNVEGNSLRKYEIEQEYHYMRRMLQTCMHVVAEKIPFHQMFTAPSVFGLMWGLNPLVRGNDWYSKLLNVLPGELLQIPWARTGKAYDLPEGDADKYDKRYHQYGLWLRTELKEEVLSVINNPVIRELGVFNDCSLDALIINWKRTNGVSNNKLDEVVSWLCSLAVFIQDNKIPKIKDDYSTTVTDYYNTIGGAGYGLAYSFARNILKK